MSQTVQPELEILNEVKTTDDVKVLDSSLDLLINALYKPRKEFDSILESQISSKEAGLLRKTFNSDPENKIKTKEILKDLKEKLQNLKVLKLTLAFDPTEKIIKEISEWIKKNLGDGIVMEIEKDRTIIGGAIVVFQGIYKDYTLAKTLEEELGKNKEEILKLISN